MEKTNTSQGSSFAEKMMYGIGDAGGAMILSFPGAYLTLYFTDNLGLSAAFIGTMMLVCRLFDGISDILMGMIVDKTHTKLGKARPWFIISIIPLVVTFIALFNVPRGFTSNGQIAYAYIMYFLMTVIFYTVNNIAYHAMLQRFSLTAADRGAVSAVRSFLCVLFAAGMNVVVPLMIPRLGGESSQHTWTVLVLIFGLISLICLVITAIGIKEKLPVVAKEDREQAVKENKAETRTALKFLLKSKYFYLVAGISLIWFASFNMIGLNYFYAREILGSGELTGAITMAAMIPSLIAMPFVPRCYNKFGKRKTICVGLVIGAAANLCVLINPYSLVLNIVCIVVKCVAGAPLMAGVATLAGDVTEYCQSKIGIRPEGLTTSVYSVGVKIGTGLGGAIAAWALAIGQYNPMLEQQESITLSVMIIAFCVVPAVLYIIGAVCMFFWDIGECKENRQGTVE